MGPGDLLGLGLPAGAELIGFIGVSVKNHNEDDYLVVQLEGMIC